MIKMMKCLMLLVAIASVVACKPKTTNDEEKEKGEQKKCEKSLCVIAIDAETDKATPVRAYVYNESGEVILPKTGTLNYQGAFAEAFGELAGRHFTTKPSGFQMDLEPGKYSIRLEKGKEYLPYREDFEIVEGKTTELNINMERWINMNEIGWYSGDLHAHRFLKHLVHLIPTEDINVAITNTIWNKHRDPDIEKYLEKSDEYSAYYIDETHCFPAISHEIERMSAILMHFTGRESVKTFETKYNTFSPPDMAYIEAAKELGGFIDLEKAFWPESHLFVTSGMVDFVGILNNHNVIDAGHLPEGQILINRNEYGSGYTDGEKGFCEFVFDVYYGFLNMGYKIMPSAGSASGVLPNPVGYNRAYVKIDGDFSYDKWFNNLKAGNSFVTNGPMLIATFNGEMSGSTLTFEEEGIVKIDMEIYDYKPVVLVEIICNGEVVKSIENPQMDAYKAAIVEKIPVSASGWVVVRCWEEGDKNVCVAHTAPVFIEIPGKPLIPDAEVLDYYIRLTEYRINELQKVEAAEQEDEQRFGKQKNSFLEMYHNGLKVLKEKMKTAQ